MAEEHNCVNIILSMVDCASANSITSNFVIQNYVTFAWGRVADSWCSCYVDSVFSYTFPFKKSSCSPYVCEAEGAQIFWESGVHFQILDARRVTQSNLHTQNSQFWSDLWTWMLPGTLCLVLMKYTLLHVRKNCSYCGENTRRHWMPGICSPLCKTSVYVSTVSIPACVYPSLWWI